MLFVQARRRAAQAEVTAARRILPRLAPRRPRWMVLSPCRLLARGSSSSDITGKNIRFLFLPVDLRRFALLSMASFKSVMGSWLPSSLSVSYPLDSSSTPFRVWIATMLVVLVRAFMPRGVAAIGLVFDWPLLSRFRGDSLGVEARRFLFAPAFAPALAFCLFMATILRPVPVHSISR